MDQDKIKALALELAEAVKIPEGSSTLSAQLIKITVEAALDAEMEAHPSYSPHVLTGNRNS